MYFLFHCLLLFYLFFKKYPESGLAKVINIFKFSNGNLKLLHLVKDHCFARAFSAISSL